MYRQDVWGLVQFATSSASAGAELGVHGAVAEHYGVRDEIERPTTLDYVIAAAAG